MNLKPLKPCATIKGTRWLKIYLHPIWNVPEPLHIYFYLPHHNSLGPRILGDIAMFPV